MLMGAIIQEVMKTVYKIPDARICTSGIEVALYHFYFRLKRNYWVYFIRLLRSS